MARHQVLEIDGVDQVAVVHQEAIRGLQDVLGVPQAAARAQDLRLVQDVHAQALRRLLHLRVEMMGVAQDAVGEQGLGPAEIDLQGGASLEGDGGLGDAIGQGAQALAVTGAQEEGG